MFNLCANRLLLIMFSKVWSDWIFNYYYCWVFIEYVDL